MSRLSAAHSAVARPEVHVACCGVFQTQRRRVCAVHRFAAVAHVLGALLVTACHGSAGSPAAPASPTTEPASAPAERALASPAAAAEPTPRAEPSAVPAEPIAPIAPQLNQVPAKTRVIRRTADTGGCVEMYGTCTPPPEKLCTSSAFYLDCGQRGQLPNSGEWLQCECP